MLRYTSKVSITLCPIYTYHISLAHHFSFMYILTSTFKVMIFFSGQIHTNTHMYNALFSKSLQFISNMTNHGNLSNFHGRINKSLL